MKCYVFPPLVHGQYDNEYLRKNFEILTNLGFEIGDCSYNEKGLYSLIKSLCMKYDLVYLNWFGDSGYSGIKGILVEIIHFISFSIHLIKRSKIVFVIHNFRPHEGRLYFSIFQYFYYKYSSLLLCHSDVVYDIVAQPYHNKINVIPHPTKPELLKFNNIHDDKHLYDFLVWGRMCEYKGIKEIVTFFKENYFSYNLALVGRCSDLELLKWIELMTLGTNIHVDMVNVDDASIIDYHQKSRFVLFNYLPNSAIISASVMYSLSLGSRICVRTGRQYKILSNSGCMFVYDSLDDFISNCSDYNWNYDNQIDYVKANDWKSFGLNMMKVLK
jgi:hypothetical protein